MRKLWVIALLLAGVGLSSGCRTLIVGTTQEVNITSKPSGALVEILGPKAPVPITEISGGTTYIAKRAKWNALGITPIQTQLNRGQAYTIRVTKPGYKPAEDKLLRRSFRFAPWFFGNLFVPVIGHIIDLSSGAGFTLIPDTLEVTLKKQR